jgi:ribose transport system ATP-binding protein
MPEIRRVADRVTILRDGEAVLTSDVGLLTDDEIIEAMLGRKPQRLFPPPMTKPDDAVAMSVNGLSVGDRVHDVTFTLRRGEILGVGGLQGQGQSTLLLALFGVVRSHGDVVIDGRRVRLGSPRAALNAGIGLALVPEDRRYQGLLLTKSVRENVTLANLKAMTRWGFLSGRKERRLALEAVRHLEIRLATVEQTVSSLSGGNQQKVVIAKLLSVGAKILLFHDLTRGIDIGTKAEIFQLARSLAASGHAIVFYSSDNQELTGLCDRILVMRAGQVAAELHDDLSEDAIMRAALAVPEALVG